VRSRGNTVPRTGVSVRVLQVFTVTDPQGSYGGPQRVALNQTTQLRSMGHHVDLVAGHVGFDVPPRAVDSVDLQSFRVERLPRLGFAGYSSRGMRAWLRSRASLYDVAHVHLGRDLVSLPAALWAIQAGIPLVVQTHGMIGPSRNPLAPFVDALATRRVLRAAHSVLTLTDREQVEVRAVEPGARLRHLGNGVPVPELPDYHGRGPEVLFLSRLHARKRPLVFVEMAAILAPKFPGLKFTIAGPDEGELARVKVRIAELGLEDRVIYEGSCDPGAASGRIQRASVFVLPAVREVFPMVLLEAFAAGTPVVATPSLGIAAACEEYGAALLPGEAPSELAEAVTRVVAEPGLADAMRRGAHAYLSEKLDIRAVAQELESVYIEAARRGAGTK